ncbi:LOW QUALITY PROTEIN: hypothetical protein HID58_047540 [Brassica napus]|uniref:Serine-threonine/tyrosine-protein kinase catalytic domain-containing protein n=1 Tax=Brassica napus TaxID=3708 RepID=A0ABQ8AZN8_BRANA|nr:LOW QUALITY PROTEIN: hypothetical protein HID58_047540 [Brassica napus]
MKPQRRQWRRTIVGSIVSYAKKSVTRISTGGNSVRKSLKIVVEKEKLKNLKECSDSCFQTNDCCVRQYFIQKIIPSLDQFCQRLNIIMMQLIRIMLVFSFPAKIRIEPSSLPYQPNVIAAPRIYLYRVKLVMAMNSAPSDATCGSVKVVWVVFIPPLTIPPEEILILLHLPSPYANDSTRTLSKNVTKKKTLSKKKLKEAQAMVSSGSVIALNHSNIVRLLGYCSERILIYDLLSNISLEDHLLTRRTSTLSWKLRPEIMFEAIPEEDIHDEAIHEEAIQEEAIQEEVVPKELIPCYNRNRETGPTAVQRFVLYEIIMGRRTIKRMKPLAE